MSLVTAHFHISLITVTKGVMTIIRSEQNEINSNQSRIIQYLENQSNIGVGLNLRLIVELSD